ncbi:MAG: sensor histidine kinase [Anaerolineae bacterium]|nr:sensor histidine kinase [Anaerolineae bacterium]
MISLKWRLTLWYVAFTVFGLLGLMSISYYLFSISLQNEIDRTLAERANHVVDALAITPNRPIQGVSLGTTDEFSAPGVFLQILNADGEVVARSFNLGTRRLPLPTLSEVKTLAPSYYTLRIDEQPVRLSYKPLTREGRIVGVVQVGQSLIGLETTLSQLRLIYTIGAAAVLLFGLLTGWVVAHFGLKPVVHLTATARDIVRAEDLARRVPAPRTKDEIAVLAATFNQMLDRLQSLFEGQHQFLSEVAHELRTPLSTMLGNVDLIVHYGEDAERRSETIRALQRTGRHVARLLDDLLLLAQAEAGWHLQMRPFSIDDILIEVYEASFNPKLQLQTCEPAYVQGDPDRLRQVLMNLLDNAMKYSPSESIIALDLWRENDRVWMQVRNVGANIPQEALSQVFAPFFRLQTHSWQPGTGLGLTIVRWIVQEHGGEISVESSLENGMTIKFWLPAYDLPVT